MKEFTTQMCAIEQAHALIKALEKKDRMTR